MKGDVITNYAHHRFVIGQDSPRQPGHEVTAVKGVGRRAPSQTHSIKSLVEGLATVCLISIPDDSHWCKGVPESRVTTSEPSEELIQILF